MLIRVLTRVSLCRIAMVSRGASMLHVAFGFKFYQLNNGWEFVLRRMGENFGLHSSEFIESGACNVD